MAPEHGSFESQIVTETAVMNNELFNSIDLLRQMNPKATNAMQKHVDVTYDPAAKQATIVDREKPGDALQLSASSSTSLPAFNPEANGLALLTKNGRFSSAIIDRGVSHNLGSTYDLTMARYENDHLQQKVEERCIYRPKELSNKVIDVSGHDCELRISDKNDNLVAVGSLRTLEGETSISLYTPEPEFKSLGEIKITKQREREEQLSMDITVIPPMRGTAER